MKGVELHPYGFAARAKQGTVLFLFEGGDVASPVMLPVSDQEGVPALEEGDAALWTASGGWIIARESGTVELYGKNLGGLIKVNELKTQLEKNNTILSTFLQTLKNPIPEPGNGSPSAFQSALNTALATAQVADLSGIESEKVLHGDGSS